MRKLGFVRGGGINGYKKEKNNLCGVLCIGKINFEKNREDVRSGERE